MAILSMRTRKKVFDYGLAAFMCLMAWTFQVTILNHFMFQGAICNLPLTMVILWGYVFPTDLPPISADELRSRSTLEIFLHQLASGSVAGALAGAFVAALYASVIPVYPICFPLIGWIAGYFAGRHLNKETLMCIPLTLFATVLAEAIMAWQLSLCGRPATFEHLGQIALPESLLNALIAPFIYFPLHTWHEFLFNRYWGQLEQ